jgi:dolichol-phosphate mannosyltransferase
MLAYGSHLAYQGMMSSITVVVPCYNEEAVLPQLFKRITKTAASWEVSWKVLLVDDGSTDGSWQLIKEQNLRDNRFCAVRFSRNFGHQPAISAGISLAKGDAVVVVDADLQDPPELIADFISKWKEGYQVVYAVRAKRKENWMKRFSYWFFYRLISRMVDFKMPLDAGDFCLMDRVVIETLKQMPERERFVRGLRAWVGYKQIGVVYERNARAAGKSKYDFRKLNKLALNGILSFSAAPLRLTSMLGFWISGLSLVGIIFTLLQRIFGNFFATYGWGPVPGYATIVMSVLFMGGVQLICMGVQGEYLGRLFEEVKHRPTWIIQDHLGDELEMAEGPHRL